MTPVRYRNVSYATVAGLRELVSSGVQVDVRGARVRELRNRLTVIERPRERCLFLPRRGNNVIATIAEALWVIAGRDDIEWLSHYLPRARNFSDDGVTWRAGYGPRLRSWNGVDQLAEAQRVLLEDPLTRRAVMSLYDPGHDFVKSRDVPCNNWLQWLIRDGRLHLTIGVRSNDVIWGFSGINSFEWSLLQEMMAHWVGVEIGDATYLATSFHLYKYHDTRARAILQNFSGVTCYDYGLSAPPFTTALADLDEVFAIWFTLEKELREDPETEVDGRSYLDDSFLTVALEMMRLHSGERHRWSAEQIAEALAQLPSCDLAAAAYELFGRSQPSILESIPDPQVAQFMEAYRQRESTTWVADGAEIGRAIKRLHEEKDAAYGTAWKKRGEITSILANVARKVDRHELYAVEGTELADESVLDTAVDLFVYLLKYRLFLLDYISTEVWMAEFPRLERPLSENQAAFDVSVDRYATEEIPIRPAKAMSMEVVESFELLHVLATERNASVEERLAAVSTAAYLAFRLVMAVANERPDSARRLTVRWP